MSRGSPGSRTRRDPREGVGRRPAAGRSLPLGGLIPVRAELLAIVLLALVGFASLSTTEDGRSPARAEPGGRPLGVHAVDPRGVRAVALSADGRRAATGGEHGLIIIRDLDRGVQEAWTIAPASVVLGLAFSPDGLTLAAGDQDASVRLREIATGSERSSLRGHTGPVQSLAFSPDGRTLATGGADESIRLWDVASGQVRGILLGHRRPVNALSFGPGGRSLASGCAGGLIKLWDLTEGRGRERAGPPIQGGPVRSLAFSPDGTLLASGGATDRIRLWDVATGRERAAFGADGSITQALAIEPDGRRLLAMNDRGDVDSWDLATGRSRAVLKRQGEVFRAAFSPDGRFVASGGLDATLAVRDLAPVARSGTQGDPQGNSFVGNTADGPGSADVGARDLSGSDRPGEVPWRPAARADEGKSGQAACQ